MLRLIGVLAALLLAACSTATAPRDSAVSQCDSAFGAWERAGFSGTVAIATDGRLDCAAGYGTADRETGRANTADTVFAIGSVTKAFTAAAIFSLVDEGKLALSDPAGKHLPELSGPAAGVTIQQLLLHTSGLNGSHGSDDEPLTRDAAIAAIGRLTLAFPPGNGYLYSNAGYTLLALIVEKLGGYRTHTASRILPLPDGSVAGGFWNGEPAAPGPRAVGYLEDGSPGKSGDFAGPHWALDGNGALAMTMPALAAWTHALFTGQIVSPESAAAIAKPGYDAGDGQSETPGWVAYDESVYGTPILATAGGGGDTGHNVVVAWLPGTKRVVAIASNGAEITAEQLLDAVGPALVADKPLPRPEVGSGDAPDDAITGTYKLATGGSLKVTTNASRPTIAASGPDAIAALFPPADAETAAQQQTHEDAVQKLLSGQTQEGREERAALEESFGPITVTVAGTISRDGETRTYVTITAKDGTHLGWYALNEAGGISAAEVPTQPPSLPLEPTGDHYRPVDPTGTDPKLTLSFTDNELTLTGPQGTITASRAD